MTGDMEADNACCDPLKVEPKDWNRFIVFRETFLGEASGRGALRRLLPGSGSRNERRGWTLDGASHGAAQAGEGAEDECGAAFHGARCRREARSACAEAREGSKWKPRRAKPEELERRARPPSERRRTRPSATRH